MDLKKFLLHSLLRRLFFLDDLDMQCVHKMSITHAVSLLKKLCKKIISNPLVHIFYFYSINTVLILRFFVQIHVFNVHVHSNI